METGKRPRGDRQMTRREQIMELTADLRARYKSVKQELAQIENELDGYRNRCAVGAVRLGDRAWDLRAVLSMIDRQIEARVDAFFAAA